MKKYCIFSDVHANIDVLRDLTKTQDFITADRRIFLGDAIGCCPFFNETLDLLFESDCVVLLGNHDMRVAFDIYNHSLSNDTEKPHFDYMRHHIRPDLMTKLRACPLEYIEEHNGKIFCFTHYVWREDRCITPRVKPITAKNLFDKFQSIDADYIFYGHEHKESYFVHNGKTMVGVGSLGMKCPGNYIMLYINDDGTCNIVRHRLPFDLDKLRADSLTTKLPLSKEIIAGFNFHE